MGLDTTHDCWHGPYGAFKRFREDVAEVAKEHYGYEPDYEKHPWRAYQGWWDPDIHEALDHHIALGFQNHSYNDPLDVFFIHSDCDGWIFPEDAGALAERLDALIGYLDDDELAYAGKTKRAALRQFVAGLREAAYNWDVVGFH